MAENDNTVPMGGTDSAQSTQPMPPDETAHAGNVQPPNPYGSPQQSAAPQQPTAAQQQADYAQVATDAPSQPQAAAQQPANPTNQQPTAPTNLDGKATGALVCGILSIVFAWTVVPSIILGIVAIVMAGSAIKQMGASSKATGGRVCGIIGLVLSILIIVFTALLVVGIVQASSDGSLDQLEKQYGISTATSTSTSSSQVETADQIGVREATSNAMDQVKNLSASDIQTLASEIDKEFSTTSGTTLASMGVSSTDMATWMTSGMTYSVDQVTVFDSTTAGATVSASTRDMDAFATEFNDEIAAYGDSDAYKNAASTDEVYQQLGSILKTSMSKTGMSEKNVNVSLTKTNGAWTVDSDQMDAIIESIYSIS